MAAAVVAGPIVVAFIGSLVLAAALPSPATVGGRLLWWVALILIPAGIFLAVDRVAKRYLPIAGLLRMTMVFPDRAPSRMAIARKVGSTRDLERRLQEAKERGVDDDPTAAAERILSLASALNEHDHRTRGHSERVRTFADMISEQLQLPQGDRDRLRWSSLLHDIGKLGVHGEILNKPGKLSDEEFAAIKAHPLEGALIAAPLAGWLGPWANTIAEHHEKYDGSGYPYGLAGDQISLGGRIVAVADCYEVMTAVRSYKTAASAEEARTELAACAGTHFDPEIVRAFLEISVGKLRRAGGLLSWLGAMIGRRGTEMAQRTATVSHSVAAGVVLVAAVSVAATQPAAFGLSAAHVSTVNLLKNGSFETPTACPSAYVTFSGSSVGLTDWTVGLASIDLICGYWTSESGKQSLDLAGEASGEVLQTVQVVPGATYLLSWWMAGNPTGGQPVKTMHVFWEGRLAKSLTFDTAGHSTTAMGWVHESLRVVATSDFSVVAFADATPDDSAYGAALDNVSLTALS
ncbi:MAG TPA: choice-of-anchor C family protein [Acidimicrobiales bacterium]|nr:choice-of-anchor C family protein [Acidimicrobiales bacterium]